MAEAIAAEVVTQGLGLHPGDLLTVFELGMEQHHLGAPHGFILLICNRARNRSVRTQAKDQALGLQVGANHNRGEIALVLVEALPRESARLPNQQVFSRSQAVELKRPVIARQHALGRFSPRGRFSSLSRFSSLGRPDHDGRAR